MNCDTVVTLISTIGFPICACLGLAYYVKYITDQNNKAVADMRQEHKEEVQKMTEALNNNTLALQKLIDRLGGGING